MLSRLTLCLLAALAAGNAHAQAVLDRIVAVVNDGVVLESELDAQVEIITAQLRAQGTRLPPPDVVREQVLENLIVQQVQLQRAERLGIRIVDEQLNATLQRIASANGISLSELPQAMATEGLDYRQYREQVRRELTIEALRQRDVVAKIAVTEREIQRWLEREEASADERTEYDISQILVALPRDVSVGEAAAAEARINDLHTRLLNGEDFAELAVSSSDGQQALNGGRLGWRVGNQIPAQFQEVITSLKPGEISDPVRSPSGFHIFRVNDTRGGTEQVVQLQSHARHILLRTNEILDDEAVRAQLERLRERILEGESFEDIARLESEDPGTATAGGDLGWNPPGTFVPEFERQLDTLEPGEISEPFKSPFGWHIVQLLERGERDTTEEVRRRNAIQAIRASKQEQETELWLRQLRDEAWVEIRS
ncbi:MAG: peptidylprolyl isomerase [Gammaproteobacteria bacterium]